MMASTGRAESDLALRELLSAVMEACSKREECPKDRKQIAAELSQRVGRIDRPITPSILFDYTGRTKTGARFPAAYVKAFCDVTGDDRLQRFILGQRFEDGIAISEVTPRSLRSGKELGPGQRLLDLIAIGEATLLSESGRRAAGARLKRLLDEAERKEAEAHKG